MQWLRSAFQRGVVLVLLGEVVFGGGIGVAAPRPGRCPTVLTGEVSRGGLWVREFGGGLVVTLEPVEGGWVLRVGPKGTGHTAGAGGVLGSPDYAEVTTPPFRSVNPLLLTMDHGFRAQDLVGWSPRSFHFVRSRDEFAKAKRVYEAVLGETRPTAAETSAEASVVAGSAEGRLEILDATLVPGSGDQSEAATLLATHFATVPHTLAMTDGRGKLGRVEWLRLRLTLGGNRAAWDTAACRASGG